MSLTMTADTVRAVLEGTVVGGNGYGISHSWNGSVLTVTSDSGSSAADLRGPAGPAGSDAERLIVTVSETAGGYASDKSFGEICEAIEQGVLPVARLLGANGESYGQLVSFAAERMLQFSAWLHGGTVDASTVITIGADDAVYVTYPAEPAAVGVSAVKSDSTVTVTVSYDDLSEEIATITLNEDGDPVSVTREGVTCALSWEGFDE